MRTFLRICVKFMAVACVVIVFICAVRVIVEVQAQNPIGVLASIFLGLFSLLLGYMFWTQTDDVAQEYIDASGWRASTRPVSEAPGSLALGDGPPRPSGDAATPNTLARGVTPNVLTDRAPSDRASDGPPKR